MKLMRNREVQRLLLLCLLGTALIAAAGFCAGIVPGVLALAGGLVLSGGVMGVTLRRYCAIAQLNQDIDRVLHGEESLPIVSNDEGELAILRSEVGKMTIRLREAADSQRRERLHLADAMADISHQLRTPLTALNLTVTLLAAEDITPERRARADARAAAAAEPDGLAGREPSEDEQARRGHDSVSAHAAFGGRAGAPRGGAARGADGGARRASGDGGRR